MSTKVTLNGNVYNLPTAGTEAGWGEDATNVIVDLVDTVSSLTGTSYIAEATFNLANTSTFTDIPVLLFNSTKVRSTSIKYVIVLTAGNKTETGTLSLHYDLPTTSWVLHREYTGDDSLVRLSVTSNGQVQYQALASGGGVMYLKTESLITV
jgi:hypothetical protein